jgi:hypothetical protein
MFIFVEVFLYPILERLWKAVIKPPAYNLYLVTGYLFLIPRFYIFKPTVFAGIVAFPARLDLGAEQRMRH